MPTFTPTITLAVRADTQADAHAIGKAAAQHLGETFNDDGSLLSAVVADTEPGAVWISARLDDQQCADILCTAAEGGISYWADVVGRKLTRDLHPEPDAPDYLSFEADIQEGPVQCDHPEIEAAEVGRFTMDWPMVRDGIRRLLAPGAEVSPAIRNDALLQLIDPEHACDADTADAIVQFAVFGEIVLS